MPKLKNFYDLTAWREAHKLVIDIYKAVDKFPKKEQFVLTSQITRAAISVTSNIAEGFGRKGKREKVQFYYLSQASLTEVQNQLLIARDIGYITTSHFKIVWKQTILISKLISGLIRSIKANS